MTKKFLVLLFIVSLMPGCSRCTIIRSEYYDITGKVITPKSSQQDIKIFTEAVERPYEEVGVVKVLARWGTSREAINEELKRRARIAGADAIMEVRYGEDTSNSILFCGRLISTRRNASAIGKAIVFKDNP